MLSWHKGSPEPVVLLSVSIKIGIFVRRLVSGAGDIKLTKDGNVLLHEMVSKSLYVSFLTLFQTTLILKNQTVSCWMVWLAWFIFKYIQYISIFTLIKGSNGKDCVLMISNYFVMCTYNLDKFAQILCCDFCFVANSASHSITHCKSCHSTGWYHRRWNHLKRPHHWRTPETGWPLRVRGKREARNRMTSRII